MGGLRTKEICKTQRERLFSSLIFRTKNLRNWGGECSTSTSYHHKCEGSQKICGKAFSLSFSYLYVRRFHMLMSSACYCILWLLFFFSIIEQKDQTNFLPSFKNSVNSNYTVQNVELKTPAWATQFFLVDTDYNADFLISYFLIQWIIHSTVWGGGFKLVSQLMKWVFLSNFIMA